MMKKGVRNRVMLKAIVLTALLFSVLSVARGTPSPIPAQQTIDGVPVEEIIRKFAANESRLRQEFKNFVFRQDITIQTLGPRGLVTGEFRRVSEIIVNDRGEREERILYFPVPTLREIVITQYDFADFAGIQPFALGLEDLPKYTVTYLGRERIDEIDTYVFEVRPRRPPDPKKMHERYFQGRIWVDTVDLMIVKVQGKGLPEDRENKFPRFETYRENIEDKLWFPTYTYADDVLDFPGRSVRVRMVIRYTNYRRFSGKIEIGDIEPEPEGKEKTEKPAGKPPERKPE
ncbi:MAG: hypothetical protein N0A16_07945 [Blastocatellia bacterium]|nr:hypothetical protein [Blastocatellia bacterium]MCS7157646.1 hypothetical protein [Blastocatellia bacterium]MCX7751911.1 hypothetical protein [Blastocatellia bacterium]MDW8167017.1 hypothetical protein [Acidobacteriota bacterium]MDW8257121.1 hypothetical protein [Acidobacteriota bacterium]